MNKNVPIKVSSDSLLESITLSACESLVTNSYGTNDLLFAGILRDNFIPVAVVLNSPGLPRVRALVNAVLNTSTEVIDGAFSAVDFGKLYAQYSELFDLKVLSMRPGTYQFQCENHGVDPDFTLVSASLLYIKLID